MIQIKRLFKYTLYSILYILLITFIITLFNYIGLLPSKIINIIKLTIPFIILFIFAYKLGKNANTKGYLEGIKISLLYILFSIIYSLLTKNNINYINFIFYMILIITSTLGSILGINKKST